MNQGIWRFAEWIDPIPSSARLTLGEGGTPLVRSRRLGPSVGLKNLFFKLEFTNPTSSYKDRFDCERTNCVVRWRDAGLAVRTTICGSSSNHAA